MKKIALILSVLVFTGACQAKTYFQNNTKTGLKFQFQNTGLGPDSNRFKNALSNEVKPGESLAADTLFDWLQWVKVFQPKDNTWVLVGERTGPSSVGWAVPESNVVVNQKPDQDKLEILVNNQ
jgi:hypothetical protein